MPGVWGTPVTVCRTPYEAYAADVQAGAKVPPPSPEQVARVALILASYLAASTSALPGEQGSGHALA